MRILTVLGLFVIMVVGASVIADYLPRQSEPIHLSCPECPPCPTCEQIALPEPIKKISPFVELCESVGSSWEWMFSENGAYVVGMCNHTSEEEPEEEKEEEPKATPDDGVEL